MADVLAACIGDEPFKGYEVSINGLSDLIVKVATTPGLHVRCSLGVSRG